MMGQRFGRLGRLGAFVADWVSKNLRLCDAIAEKHIKAKCVNVGEYRVFVRVYACIQRKNATISHF